MVHLSHCAQKDSPRTRWKDNTGQSRAQQHCEKGALISTPQIFCIIIVDKETINMVKHVESEGEWMALMNEEKLVVVDFTASW